MYVLHKTPRVLGICLLSTFLSQELPGWSDSGGGVGVRGVNSRSLKGEKYCLII